MSAETLKPYQKEILDKVYNIALTIPDKDGQTYQTTLQAMCLTETDAGRLKIGDIPPDGSLENSSIGPLQVRVDTIKWLATKVPEIKHLKKFSKIELAHKLKNDNNLAIKVGIHYFIYNKNKYGYEQAISRYNGGTKNYKYIAKVKKNYKRLNSLKYSYNINKTSFTKKERSIQVGSRKKIYLRTFTVL
jgi:hypothetical protein